MDNILVSISCVTYNHEDFIADAIESMLMQKTDFNYEILIYDDASTDTTAEIIRGYESQYPHIIKPIYQTENQYSKKKMVDRFNIDRANGKYIAICEGDDYWTDPNKLQKQIDFMEDNADCSLCFHAGYMVSAEDKKTIGQSRPHKENKYFSVDELIEGGGGLFNTNAMVYRTECDQNRPAFFNVVPDIHDYHLVINLGLQGKVYYMDEFMSAYRVGVSGSWTEREFSELEKKKESFRKLEVMLGEVNEFTNFQYAEAIKRANLSNQFLLLIEEGKFKELKSGEYRKLYDELPTKRKLIYFVDQYSPKLSKFLRTVNRRLVGWTTT
ncbi:glycosyltransferase [Ureibacillus chungkukjangi]|uniref:glycosyltransferase family 2 protein n=1 Tax=Ureibacillus chungkukjangi TaxID=1202712 RepID=UPI00384C21F3